MLSSILLILFIFIFLFFIALHTQKIGFEGVEKTSLARFAFKNNNPSICERARLWGKGPSTILSFSYIQYNTVEDCYIEYARISNNSSICEAVGIHQRALCFYDSKENLNCKALQKKDSISSCYYVLALNTKNKDLCKKVTPLTELDHRYNGKFQILFNGKIKDVNKEECERLIEKIIPNNLNFRYLINR